MDRRTDQRLGNVFQTFNADFTTAHIEHTDRNGMAGMYNDEGDRWAREVGAEWKKADDTKRRKWE